MFLLDTSALSALLNQDDPRHAEAAAFDLVADPREHSLGAGDVDFILEIESVDVFEIIRHHRR